jgi:hypothetical protein
MPVQRILMLAQHQTAVQAINRLANNLINLRFGKAVALNAAAFYFFISAIWLDWLNMVML